MATGVALRRILLGLFLAAAVFAQDTRTAAEWLPEGAIMVATVHKPADVLGLANELHLFELATSASPDMRNAMKMLDGIAGRTGSDAQGMLLKLAGGGIVYASYPGDNNVTVVDAQDQAAVDALRQIVQFVMGMQKPAPGAQSKTFYKEYPGAVVFSFDGSQFFAIAGKRIIMSNRAAVLKTLFERKPGEGKTLAASPRFVKAREAVGDVAVSLLLDMAVLNQAPPVKNALGVSDQPLDALFGGPVKHSLRNSTWAALGLRIDGRSLYFNGAVDGSADQTGRWAFASPAGGAGVLPNLQVPGQIAALTLWRDLHRFYAAKETLFPEKSSGAILFENFMEIFFSGRDLRDEVFARFDPAVRLVVARQRYDGAIGTPLEQYPAAALVFRVDKPEEFGEVFEEAWQKAVGITNFTRGQQALPGLIIDKGNHAGVTYTYCYYSARAEKDRTKLPSRFNVRPALVRAGPYLIVSSTDGLARDLIDAVNKEDARRVASPRGINAQFEISNGADIAALLSSNRAELIRQSVVNKGAKPKDAEAEFNRNLAMLEHFDRAKLSFSAGPSGQRAELELHLK